MKLGLYRLLAGFSLFFGQYYDLKDVIATANKVNEQVQLGA